jgi:hypothetical protein
MPQPGLWGGVQVWMVAVAWAAYSMLSGARDWWDGWGRSWKPEVFPGFGEASEWQ